MGLEVLTWLRLWADKPAFDLQRLSHVSHTKSALMVLLSGRLRFILLITMLSSLLFSKSATALWQVDLHFVRSLATVSQLVIPNVEMFAFSLSL